MTRRFIRLAQVKDKTAQSKASIYRGVASGTFPAPYSIGARSVAWLESDVDTWMESRPPKTVKPAISVQGVAA